MTGRTAACWQAQPRRPPAGATGRGRRRTVLQLLFKCARQPLSREWAESEQPRRGPLLLPRVSASERACGARARSSRQASFLGLPTPRGGGRRRHEEQPEGQGAPPLLGLVLLARECRRGARVRPSELGQALQQRRARPPSPPLRRRARSLMCVAALHPRTRHACVAGRAGGGRRNAPALTPHSCPPAPPLHTAQTHFFPDLRLANVLETAGESASWTGEAAGAGASRAACKRSARASVLSTPRSGVCGPGATARRRRPCTLPPAARLPRPTSCSRQRTLWLSRAASCARGLKRTAQGGCRVAEVSRVGRSSAHMPAPTRRPQAPRS